MQPVNPGTSTDPYTAMLEDRMRQALEEQERTELSSPPRTITDPHLLSMMRDLERHFGKLMSAAVELSRTPAAMIEAQRKSCREIESNTGKLLTGIRFFVPAADSNENAVAIQATSTEALTLKIANVTPGLTSVVKSLGQDVIDLNQFKAVVSQLKVIQRGAKALGRKG